MTEILKYVVRVAGQRPNMKVALSLLVLVMAFSRYQLQTTTPRTIFDPVKTTLPSTNPTTLPTTTYLLPPAVTPPNTTYLLPPAVTPPSTAYPPPGATCSPGDSPQLEGKIFCIYTVI